MEEVVHLVAPADAISINHAHCVDLTRQLSHMPSNTRIALQSPQRSQRSPVVAIPYWLVTDMPDRNAGTGSSAISLDFTEVRHRGTTFNVHIYHTSSLFHSTSPAIRQT